MAPFWDALADTRKTLSAVRARLTERATPGIVLAVLEGMALMLNNRPSLRHHLKDRHPTGVPFVFDADFLFATRDRRMQVHARFGDGKMRVGLGGLPDPDVSILFRDPGAMRAFFDAGVDPMSLLLANDVNFDGNLSCMLKFGHMSTAVIRNGQRMPVPPGRTWSRGPARWQDLPAPPTGEPARERPRAEVKRLGDPYLASYSLDDFPRIKRLLWAHRTIQPEVCTERPRLLTEFKLEQHRRNGGREQETPALRQARALRHVLIHRQAIIRDDDLLAGTTTSKRIGVVIYPEAGGTGLWAELLTMEARELNPYLISDADVEILDRQVYPFWMSDNIREWTRAENGNPLEQRLDERFALYFLWKTQAVSHTIADTPKVLDRGLLDIRDEAAGREKRARKPEKQEFYRALQVAIDGVLDYGHRLAREARREAGRLSGPDAEARREALLSMAAACERVPGRPPESLFEALQALWILFLCQHMESTNTGHSIGRLDLWLDRYLQRDLADAKSAAARRRGIERALENTCAFMLKLTDHLPMVPDLGNRLFGGSSSDQVITLGGLTRDGESAVCDMTWIFLKATEMLRLRDPNMNARFAPGVNSEAYLRRLCEVNLLTRATPSIHNDSAMVPALVEQGFAIEDARDWGATGCVEPTSCGRHFGHTNCMMFNLVAPLEMALRDGFHPVVGEQVGPRTGDARSFESYEQFLEAYKSQLAWLIDRSVIGNNMLGEAHQALRPYPLLSALFDGPMDKGKDLIDGGARYNSSGTAMIGLSDVVDSLAAMKTLVYSGNSDGVSMSRMVEALEDDFEGHEALLARLLHRVPKFGQDHDLPRSIAHEIQQFVFECFQKHRNYRGGRYVPGYWSMSNHVAFGLFSGALPSGRRRGKAFTPGLTPSPLSGAALTEQIQTVAGLDSSLFPNNIAFNVKVVPGGRDSHADVLDRMTAYTASYFDLGGMQIQFNVVSSETLKDAMNNPDSYRDLLVRISGYNAYFVELNRDMQIELIERTEHALGGG